MATGQLSVAIQHLRRAMLRKDGAELTDAQLLQDYLSRRDEAALAAIVGRHGPMVWSVCRRVLSNYHDAEDAFQATFLVLVRRAASIASPELLANWLYGVAHQTARKARATVAKRKGRERQVAQMPEPAVVEQHLRNDLLPLLDQELSRLPDSYRVVIVLCDLEGKTRKEAARHLGLPEGTIASRLARARALLAKRITQRGITLSGGALAAILWQNVASAGIPALVASNTIKVANLLAAGQTTTALISGKVAALTEGVLQVMFLNKLRSATCVLLMLATIGLAASGLAHWTQAADHPASLSPSDIRKQDDSNLKETVLALEKRIFEAYKAQDRAAFQSLLSDDFEGVNPLGYRYDKACELKYVSNFCTTEYELKDAKVILLTRNSALVTYEVHYKVRPTGAEKIIENTTSHRTAAWVQRNGKWWRVYVEDRVAQK